MGAYGLPPMNVEFRGFETPKDKFLSGALLVGLAFVAFKFGQESVRTQKTVIPSTGTLVGTYIVFRALDALWPEALKPAEKTT